MQTKGLTQPRRCPGSVDRAHPGPKTWPEQPRGLGTTLYSFRRGPTRTMLLLPLVQAHGKGDRPWSLTPPVSSDQLGAEGFPRPGPRDPLGSGDHLSVRWMAMAPQGQGAGCRPRDTLLGHSTFSGLWLWEPLLHGPAGPAAVGGSHVSAADPLSGSGVGGNCPFLGAQGAVTNPPLPGRAPPLPGSGAGGRR